jgi:hypothetical protein
MRHLISIVSFALLSHFCAAEATLNGPEAERATATESVQNVTPLESVPTEKKYSVTIYVALPGTPLLVTQPEGQSSIPGHLYYVTRVHDAKTLEVLSESESDNKEGSSLTKSWGFAPKKHGAIDGPGAVQINDLDDYQTPYYARTIEISPEQHQKLNAFGQDPAKHGFNMHYSWHNNCVDFTWLALHYAGISANTLSRFVLVNTVGLLDADWKYDGTLIPENNVAAVRSIKPPYLKAALNSEQFNRRPLLKGFRRTSIRLGANVAYPIDSSLTFISNFIDLSRSTIRTLVHPLPD